jgi:hypothetical protein
VASFDLIRHHRANDSVFLYAFDLIQLNGDVPSLSTCYRSWKARGRPASRRTSSTVDVLAPRPPFNGTVVTVVIMPRKDGASQRLASEIALAKSIKALEETPKEALEETPTLTDADLATKPLGCLLGGTSREPQLNEYPPYPLCPHSDLYLQLDENAPWDRPILDAFKAFELDPRYLSHWRKLLGHLSYVLFPGRRPGAPRRWTDERLCRLLANVAAYKRKNPEASDTAICKWLKKKWPDDTPGRLRRVLQDARKPARNDLLARMAYDLMTPQMLREAFTKDASLTEVDDLLFAAFPAALRKAIEEADKLWGH